MKKYIISKMFWDYETEEAWLNEMSLKGYAMTDYSWCKYTFQGCVPGEYTYRIELLEKKPEEGMSDLIKIEDNNIELVTNYARRVFYRKRTSEGIIKVNTDKDVKVKHYEKVFILFYILMMSNMAIGLGNIIISRNAPSLLFSIMIGIVSVILGCAIGITTVLPLYRKIKKIKKEYEVN